MAQCQMKPELFLHASMFAGQLLITADQMHYCNWTCSHLLQFFDQVLFKPKSYYIL